MKALFHIDERHKWPMVQANIKNMLAETDAEIALVANSEAVELFIKSTITLEDKVTYYVCNNSITQRHLDRNDLNKKAKITGSGVVQIVKLQDEGFRYIKP
jgi:intracellular sulfur oxidation DsrE/DsrF family protein